MKKTKQLISMILLLTLLLSQSMYAEDTTVTGTAPDASADVQSTSTEQVMDIPSVWALWEVQMASVYGLGDAKTYSHYVDSAEADQLLAIEASIEKVFGVVDTDKIATGTQVTRGTVAKEFYDLIDAALKIDGEPTAEVATKYFADKGIIRGKGHGDLDLDQVCSTQELILIAKRVYDNLTYALDMDSKGCFWKVSDEDNTVYLLGSIHVTDGSVYPMSKNIMNSFVSADYLAVEANVLVNKPEDTAYIQQIMMLEGDQTLDKMLSKENYEKYARIVSSAGVTEAVYNKLKPWYATLLVQNLMMASANLQGSMGIDVYFLSAATGYKPIIEVESVREQIDMLNSFSDELQIGELVGVLEDTNNESVDSVNTMLQYWKTGNVDELAKMVNMEESTDPLVIEFNEKLLTTRNEGMLTDVEAMLKEDHSHIYFVVLGAAHMLNSDGIVQSLLDDGYTVEQVK